MLDVDDQQSGSATTVTATSDAVRPDFHRGGRVERLDEAECRELLSANTVGRLAYVTPEGPRIVPMNYVLTGDTLLFRTSADNEVARWSLDGSVAFEVDDLDAFLQAGWSVLVTGVADEVPAEAFRALDVSEKPDPWAEGVRPLVLRLPLSSVTGRRVQTS